ncbi:MAG: FtsX-like permease family protein [Desulfobacteraceae bacterium]|jgi:ABC-type lipoprotein release transport system permease subunit
MAKGKAMMVVLPLGLIVSIVSAFSFFFEGVKQDALLAASHYPDILIQQQVGGRTESLLFDRYDDLLSEIKEIRSYHPRSWGYINHTDKTDSTKAFVVMGLDPEFIDAGLFIDASIEHGRSLTKFDTNQGIVGKALAAAFNCRIGDHIEVSSPGLRQPVLIEVVGIFDSAVEIYSADLLLVPRPTANKILGFLDENECSDIMIYMTNPAMVPSAVATITQTIDGAYPLTKDAMQRLSELSFGQKSGLFHLLWFVLLFNVLIIAWSMVGQISFNLRKEIGILKAIGWDTEDIILVKTFETITIGIIAVLTGLTTGIAFMLMGAPGIKGMIIGWANVYPDFSIPLYVDATTIFVIVILGIIPLLVGALIPVWRIGTIDPDLAIRQ